MLVGSVIENVPQYGKHGTDGIDAQRYPPEYLCVKLLLEIFED